MAKSSYQVRPTMRMKERLRKAQDSRLETLQETPSKYNFTPVIQSGSLEFSFVKNDPTTTVKVEDDVPKHDVKELDNNKQSKEMNVFQFKLEVPKITTPRSIVCAVLRQDINLLKDLLKENRSKIQDQMNHALMLAVTMKQANMVQYLIDSGADMHAFDEKYPVILTAVDTKAKDILEILLHKTNNINVCSNYGNLIHSAARTYDLDLMKRAFQVGVDINLRSRANGATPLHESVKFVQGSGAYSALTLEENSSIGIKYYVDNNKVTNDQINADNKIEIYKEENDSGITGKSNTDLSPIKFLIRIGCEIDIKDHNGKTPLHEASSIGNTAVVQCLLNAGAQPDTLDNNSNTPFMYALQRNHFEVANMLVDETKLNVPVTDHDTDCFAHLACKYDSFKTLEYLISKGADMTVTSNGETPLMIAVTKQPNEKCVSVLLKCNCGINYTNKNGNTALDLLLDLWPQHISNRKILDLMVSHGATVNHVHPETGHTPLIKHISHKEKVTGLLENGADIDFVSQNGDNALLQACFQDDVSAVNSLMTHNINMNVSDKVRKEGEHRDMTPLQISIINQNSEITNMLLCAGCSLRNVHSWIKSEYCHKLRDSSRYYEDVLSYIQNIQHKPNTLENIARHSVVKMIGVSRLDSDIGQISLPKLIKSCLSWNDFYAARKNELLFI